MNKKGLTHKDLSDALGVSETTVKSYRKKFPGCIPVASNGKPIRFSESALEVATHIRDYFELGMSVKEVRLRLSQQYPWITQEEEKTEQPPVKQQPDLSHSVSNMAKSMVSMAQQQKSITKRMQAIEMQLDKLGITPSDIESIKATEANSPALEERLDHLDALTGSLAQTVSALAEKFDHFLGERAKAAEEWKERQRRAKEEGTSTNVIAFGSVKNTSKPVQEGNTKHSAQVEAHEPPRSFYFLPLVVRNTEGRYAGVKGRVRFTLNDLKALLIYGYEPTMRYSMRWEPHGDGWWLYLERLEQEDKSPIHLLLMEIPTQRGEDLLEVLQVKKNGEVVHPMEICAIIDNFGQMQV